MSKTLPKRPDTLLQYTHLSETDIHELVFFHSSRETAELGLQHMVRVFNAVTPTTPVRILLDMRLSGMLPLTSIISQGRSWTQQVRVHPPTRLALLAQNDSMLSLVKPIFNMMRFGHLQTRFFAKDGRDEAIAWLIGSD